MAGDAGGAADLLHSYESQGLVLAVLVVDGEDGGTPDLDDLQTVADYFGGGFPALADPEMTSYAAMGGEVLLIGTEGYVIAKATTATELSASDISAALP